MGGLITGLMTGFLIAPDTAQLDQQTSELEATIKNLQADLESKNRQFGNLQIALLQKDALVADLLSQSQAKSETIANLLSQIHDSDVINTNLQSQIETLTSDILILEQQLETEVLSILFSPNGGCENEIIDWISRANTSIHILIYSFTLDSISDALVEAQNNGIEVQVIFEKNQITEDSEYQKLEIAGISVRNDTNSMAMHDKIMIIDGIVVFTGSFNWSANGEQFNNENLIVINSTYVATIYEEEFEKIWEASIPG
jgi:phosphatidylserine/phosphatidylglycerophosphate/cardiolipin synthase-like enzyme